MADQNVEIRIRVQAGDAASVLQGLGAAARQAGASVESIGTAARQAAPSIADIAKGTALGQAAFQAAALAVRTFAHAVGSLPEIIRGALQEAGALGETAAKLGVSAQALQEYGFAARQVGVAQGELEQVLVMLNRRLGEAATGSGNAGKVFRALGIELRDAAGNARTTEQVFEESLRVIESFGNEAERAAIKTALFGRAGGPVLNRLLMEGVGGFEALRDEAQRLGIVLSDEMIRAADAASDRLDAMSQVIRMQVLVEVAKLAPQILEVTNRLIEAIPAIAAWVEWFGSGLVDAVGAARASLRGFGEEVERAMKGGLLGIAAGGNPLGALLGKVADVSGLSDAVGGLARSLRAQSEAAGTAAVEITGLGMTMGEATSVQDQMTQSVERQRPSLAGLLAAVEKQEKAHKGAADAAKGATAQAEDAVAALRAEVAAREAAAAAGLTVAETEAKVAAAKTLAKTGSVELAAATEQETLALAKLNEQNAKLKAGETAIQALKDQTAELAALAVAYDEAGMAGGSYREIQDALAIAAEKQKGANAQQAAELEKLKRQQLEMVEAEQARKASLEALQELDQEGGLREEIALLEQVTAGTLSLAEAERELAVRREEAKGVPAERAQEVVAAREEVERLREQAKATTVDIGDEIGRIFDGIVDGILQGTSGGLDAMEVLKRGAQTIFADMLKGMIQSKLNFDIVFEGNFLQVLPAIVARGANLIRDLFSGSLDSVGSDLATVGNSLTGGTGGSGGGGLIGNLQTAVSLGRQAWNLASGLWGGGSAAALAATPVYAGYGVLAPGIVAGGSTLAAGGGVVAPGLAMNLATGEIVGSGLGAGAGASTAGASLAGVAGTAGIAAAVASAIVTAMAAVEAGRARKGFFGYGGAREFVAGQFDVPIIRELGNIVSILSTFSSARSSYGAMQRVFGGEGQGFFDYFRTVMLGFVNPLSTLLAIMAQPPTRGTALRKTFEEFIEQKEIGLGNEYRRGAGQEATRALIATGEFTPEQFPEAMTAVIDRTAELIGLNEKQKNQLIAIGALFRSEIGEKAGNEIQRALGPTADLIVTMQELGYSAQEVAEVTARAFEQMGDPRKLIRSFNEFIKSSANDISQTVQEQTVQGFATLLFADVPAAVDVAGIALEQFRAKGELVFEDLQKRVAAATAEAEALVPALQQVFKAGISGEITSPEQFSTQMFDALGQALKETIAQAVFDGLIEATLKGDIIGPLMARVTEAIKQYKAGEITRGEMMDVVAQAAADARIAMRDLQPLIDDLAMAGRELGMAFDEAEDSVLGLATAIVRLEEAQRQFNNSLEAQIFALRNRGAASPEIIRRQIPDIYAEATAIVGKYFPPTGRTGTAEEQMGALSQLQVLTERWLAAEIAAINAQLAAQTKVHQERITALQREREEIQRTTQAAIDARQEELSTLQDQLQIAQEWQGVLDQLRSSILSIQGGALNPEGGMARVSALQAEIARQQGIFATGTEPERQAAAQALAQLGPQLLQTALEAGIPQSSEQFRVLFDQVLGVLDAASAVAAEQAKDAAALQARIATLNTEIRDLTKAQSTQLAAIDASIRSEQDAIVAAQDRAQAAIDAASEKAAGILEWIQGQGNAIYEQRHDELTEKLSLMEATTIDLRDISYSSLTELERIRRVIEEQGSTIVPFKSGEFGITPSSQQNVRANLLAPGAAASPYIGRLRNIEAAGVQQALDTGLFAEDISFIRAIFPRAQSADDFARIIRALIEKAEMPDRFQPVLGFAAGGLVSHEMLGRLAEGNRPELIVPLSRLFPSGNVQAGLAALGSARTDTGPPTINVSIQNTSRVEMDATLDLSDPEAVKGRLRAVFRQLLIEGLSLDDVRARVGQIARDLRL